MDLYIKMEYSEKSSINFIEKDNSFKFLETTKISFRASFIPV